MSSPAEHPSVALPVLPLRDVVVFPHMVIPLFVGRDKSIRALDIAMEGDKRILLVAQKSAETDDPGATDLHTDRHAGAGAAAVEAPRRHDQGAGRRPGARQGGWASVRKTARCRAMPTWSTPPRPASRARSRRSPVRCMSMFEQYVKINRKIPPELLRRCPASTIPAAGGHHCRAPVVRLQRQAEIARDCRTPPCALEMLMGLVDGEIDVQQMEKRIRGRVKKQMEKSQREYYLNEQMKAIQKELGDLRTRRTNWTRSPARSPPPACRRRWRPRRKAELNKLKQMSPMSAEATWCATTSTGCWACRGRSAARCARISRQRRTLDADHYGLEKVKERILEYLAVQTRVAR
jgi:ATP-dependent Lon protease